MWPGQQPGGEQNPQNQQPNPYRTPGYQAPNPYRTPGYQAPDPYRQDQPGAPWGHPAPPGAPQPPHGSGGKEGKGGRNVAIAVVAAVAVIAAAVVTGVFVLGDGDEGKNVGSGGTTASPSTEPTTGGSTPAEEPSERGDDPTNPRDGVSPEKPDPVVSGWQVVTNAKHHNAFDVPADWDLGTETTIIGYGQKDEDKPFSGPQVAFSGPAFHKQGWCEDDGNKYTRAIVGSKGGQGSRNTAEGAEIAAENFVYFAYGEQKETVKRTEAKKFSNEHGITGHIATATATGVKKESKCDSDGKVVAVSWIDGSHDLRIWVLVTDAGVDDEVSQETIDKMTGSLRPYAEED